jgi:membrane fusion protein (multidrug efflux system)
VGTLVANESVNIVPELSRRLVRVHVDEGAQVEAGKLLFELDDADLRAAEAELVARRRLAADTLERQRRLLAEDPRALSDQDHERALADLAALDAQLRAKRVELEKTRIRAPFAGTIGLRRVSEGAWVTPQTLLSTLQDRSRIKIDFTLPERHASLVAPGQVFQFRVAGRSEPASATVLAVEPAIEAATRSLLVRGVAQNPDASLFPGAFAAVELPLAGVAEGVVVPAEALVPSVEGHGLYVLRDGHAELRPVEIGVRGSDSVQIVRGLEAGERVLRTNLLRLRPGVAVTLEPEG